MMALILHLMILTSDKIQWELFFCPTPTPLCCARVVPVFVASDDMHGRAVGLFYTQPTGHLWYWRQIKFSDSYFLASDDINIRQNSVVSFVLHLKILTSDKFQWYLFFCIWLYFSIWYQHQTNCTGICFSASDDINIRQNSMMSVFLHLMI